MDDVRGVNGVVAVVNEEGAVVEEECADEYDVDGAHSGRPRTFDIALKMLVVYKYNKTMPYYRFAKINPSIIDTCEMCCTYSLFQAWLEFQELVECDSRWL